MQLSPTPLSSKFVSTGKEEGRRRTVLAIKLKFRRKRKKKERKRGRRGEKFSTSLRASPFPCGNCGKRVKFEFPEMKTVTARRDALPASWIQRRLRFETFRRRSFLIWSFRTNSDDVTRSRFYLSTLKIGYLTIFNNQLYSKLRIPRNVWYIIKSD